MLSRTHVSSYLEILMKIKSPEVQKHTSGDFSQDKL